MRYLVIDCMQKSHKVEAAKILLEGGYATFLKDGNIVGIFNNPVAVTVEAENGEA